LARERRGLSQGELARASGVAQALISRYESGQVEPSLRTVQRLVNAAGVVMTIDVDGLRLIDTTRMPTAEETAGIEVAFEKMLESPPEHLRPAQEAARRR